VHPHRSAQDAKRPLNAGASSPGAGDACKLGGAERLAVLDQWTLSSLGKALLPQTREQFADLADARRQRGSGPAPSRASSGFTSTCPATPDWRTAGVSWCGSSTRRSSASSTTSRRGRSSGRTCWTSHAPRRSRSACTRTCASAWTRSARCALDALAAPDRYIVAPRLVDGTDVFLPDREPLGTIRRLFKLRNRLVHPKVGRLRVRAGGLVGTSDYEHFNPETAADMAIAVATAMRTIDSLLANNGVKSGWDLSFDSVLAGEQILRRAGRTWKEHLPPPPKLRALIRRAVDPPEPHRQAPKGEGPSS
jgi:hypothetical protein